MRYSEPGVSAAVTIESSARLVAAIAERGSLGCSTRRMPMELPEEIAKELHDRYCAVAQARADGDSVAAELRYAEFERFCHKQTVATGSSTFHCGLAILTQDDSAAFQLFHEALALAKDTGEAMHDVLFPLAMRHFHRDEHDLVRRFATEARDAARVAGDVECVRDAEALLAEIDNAT